MANAAGTNPRGPLPIAPSRLGSQTPRAVIARLCRYLGALALLGVGFDHIQQYSVDSYSAIPTIGTLFALNFASALVVALGLVVPLERLSPRWGGTLLTLLAAAGAGIAVGSFAGLALSETTGLFGFMESGYRGAIVLAIALDTAAVIFLSAFLGAGWRSRPPAATPQRSR